MFVSQITKACIQGMGPINTLLKYIKDINSDGIPFGEEEIDNGVAYYELNIDRNAPLVQTYFNSYGIDDIKCAIVVEDDLIQLNIDCEGNLLRDYSNLLTIILIMNEGLSLTAIKKNEIRTKSARNI